MSSKTFRIYNLCGTTRPAVERKDDVDPFGVETEGV